MADRKPHPLPPADVVSIDKTDEHFRLIYDAKGRFVVHRISSTEAQVSVPSHRGLRAGFYPKTGPSGTARVFHPLARRRSRLTILPASPPDDNSTSCARSRPSASETRVSPASTSTTAAPSATPTP